MTSKVLPILKQLGCPQSQDCKAALMGIGVIRRLVLYPGHLRPLGALGTIGLWDPDSKSYSKLK